MSTTETVLVSTLGALIVLSFALAAAEASLLRVRRSAVAVRAERGDRRSARLLDLLDDLPRVMNAVLLAVLLIQVTAATIAGVLAERRFGGTGVTLATVVITLTLFVYGEAIPKTLAVREPVEVARFVARPVNLLSRVLRPVVTVLVRFADLQTPGAGITTVSAVDEDELRHLADEAAAAGEIADSDVELIDRAFVLGDLRVAQILVPRVDVVAVSGDTSVFDALELAMEAGHRRIPVHDGDIDQITGVVRMRDLVGAVAADPDGPVSTLMRDVIAVPEAKSVVEVLREMQASGNHLAVIIDEYGGTTGIVTIEDVVEELVGTIADPWHTGASGT